MIVVCEYGSARLWLCSRDAEGVYKSIPIHEFYPKSYCIIQACRLWEPTDTGSLWRIALIRECTLVVFTLRRKADWTFAVSLSSITTSSAPTASVEASSSRDAKCEFSSLFDVSESTTPIPLGITTGSLAWDPVTGSRVTLWMMDSKIYVFDAPFLDVTEDQLEADRHQINMDQQKWKRNKTMEHGLAMLIQGLDKSQSTEEGEEETNDKPDTPTSGTEETNGLSEEVEKRNAVLFSDGTSPMFTGVATSCNGLVTAVIYQ
jgi:hypothetical protein